MSFRDVGALQSGGGLDVGALEAASAGPQTLVSAGGIPSAEAFGAGTVGSQFLVSGGGIPSDEAFGHGAVNAQFLVSGGGIASAEAFGSGTLTTGVKSLGGIPSAEAFGAGAIILVPLTIFIEGVDLSEKVLVSSANFPAPSGGSSTAAGPITVNNQLSQMTTAGFMIFDKTGTLNIQVGQQVLIYSKGTRVFGGSISAVTVGAYMALPSRTIAVSCSDFSYILDRRIVGRYYEAPSFLTTIVEDLVQNILNLDGITYDGVDGDPGVQLGDVLFNWITCRQAFQQLSTLTGWEFNIDVFGVLRWFPSNVALGVAPFELHDNDGHWLAETMFTSEDRSNYRNRQGVLSSSQVLNQWTDTYSAAIPGPFPNDPQAPNGSRSFFVTFYTLAAAPTVTVNGVPQTVISINQIATAPPGWNWYWIPNGSGVQQNATQTPLGPTDVLQVSYPSQLPQIIWVENDSQIAARKAIEGGSGIYENVATPVNLTTAQALTAYAEGLLARYGIIPVTLSFMTDLDGLVAGQLILVNVTEPPAAGAFLITQVQAVDVDKTFLRYTVTGVMGYYQGTWTQFFNALVDRGSPPQPAQRTSYTWLIAPSYPGITNPGLNSSGYLAQYHITQYPVEILQFVTVNFGGFLGFPSPPSSDLQITILVASNGVLQFTFPANSTEPMTVYFPPNTQAFAGDIIQVVTGPSPDAQAKDGTVTIVSTVAVT